MSFILPKTKEIQSQINNFINIVSETSILFYEGIEEYLANRMDEFEVHLDHIRTNENKADDLRFDIERKLYQYTLLPESRGDILAILENTDEVIDNMKDSLLQFSIEKPEISPCLTESFRDLAKASHNATDKLMKAVRAFFIDSPEVNEYVHKVHFYEKEGDRIAEKLKRLIFESELPLEKKIHLRNFAVNVELISDYAQDVSDRLTIYAIKRNI